MRKKIIAANYKMNFTCNEAESFIDSIKDRINVTDREVVICPNFVALDRVSNVIDGTNIKLGAQNVYFEQKGAYTGETSVDMVYGVGCDYVILGHSERREIFKEADEDINKKVIKVLEKGMKVILCVGETLEERESHNMFNKVSNQLKKCLKDVNMELIKNVVIAYEPIWAIGTGKTATVDEAIEMCKFIRNEILNLYNENISDNICILYGGSVKPSNAKDLIDNDYIDGALVGGASLTNDFVAIVNY